MLFYCLISNKLTLHKPPVNVCGSTVLYVFGNRCTTDIFSGRWRVAGRNCVTGTAGRIPLYDYRNPLYDYLTILLDANTYRVYLPSPFWRVGRGVGMPPEIGRLPETVGGLPVD